MILHKWLALGMAAWLSGLLVGCEGSDTPAGPAATDYAQAAHWLAVPTTVDKPVDVFYLYPTSWRSTATTPQVCAIDEPTLLTGAPASFARQATAFSTVGNIYAPFYRQGNLASITVPGVVDGLPTTDAIAAFDYYITHDNHGRPYILAAHSQGAQILCNLLSSYMRSHPSVYQRMVAAYAIGFPVTADYLAANPHLKFADGPDDTGVIISYNTQAPDLLASANPVLMGKVGLVINPISWTRSETPAPTADNLGSFMPNPATGVYGLVPQYADARIDIAHGVLICSSVNEDALFQLTGAYRGLYHGFDYPFYYYNLRANAANRVSRYLAQQP